MKYILVYYGLYFWKRVLLKQDNEHDEIYKSMHVKDK
jgi:hypothetical protein